MDERWKNAAIEMRRTAVNYLERWERRCEVEEECNQFATWTRAGDGYPRHACDYCIEVAREEMERAVSSGIRRLGRWVEIDHVDAVRDMIKASAGVGGLLDEDLP